MRKIALEEFSGPVSPKFQWRLKLVIADLDVDYERTGEHAEKKKGTLAKDVADALWKDLDAKKAFALGGALDKKKVGVGINTLVLECDKEKMTLEYTTNGLTADQKAVIDAIKKAASSIS